MSSASLETINCPSCGASNSRAATVCRRCSGQMAALLRESPSTVDLVLQTSGFFLIALGLALLVMAVYFHYSVESAWAECGTVSFAGGIALVLIGAFLRPG